MTLFLIGVALLGMLCRLAQVKLDRYARSLQPSDELKAALMEQRKGWSV